MKIVIKSMAKVLFVDAGIVLVIIYRT